MMKDYKIEKYFLISFYGIVAILFYLLSIYTPLMADDFVYVYSFNEYGADILSPIKSINDIICSQYQHYFNANGRSIVHFGEQLFVGILGRGCFNVFNTVVFVLLLYGGTYLVSVNRSLMMPILLFLLIWFLIPVPGETLLWMAGSFNYLWSTFLVIIFLSLMKNATKWMDRQLMIPVLFVIGVFCGWAHEGLSVGVSGALFIYYCFNRRKFVGKIVPLVFGFWLGTAFVLFAPSIWNRAQSALNEKSMIEMLVMRVRFLMYTKIFPALVIVMGYCFFRHKLFLKGFVKEYALLVWIVLFEFLFGCMIGLQSIRQVFFIEFFSALLLGRILDTFLHDRSVLLKKILLLVLGICFSIDYSFSIKSCINNYELYQNMFSAAKYSINGVIPTSYKRRATYFTTHYESRFVHAYFFSHNPTYYLNSMFSFYTHNSSMIVLPEKMYEDLYKSDHFCNKSNLIFEHIYTKSDIDFYVMPVENLSEQCDCEKLNVKYFFDLTPLNELPWYMKLLRPFVKRLNPPESMIASSAVTLLRTSHGDYLLIDKPYFMDMGVKLMKLELQSSE